MKTIDELLVEFGTATFKRGQGMGSLDDVKKAEAAVDAKIKEMQDRIAELEATLTAEYVRSNEHVDRMEIYTEQIIQHKEAEVRSLESRIAELERENGEMRDKLNNPFYGVELYVRKGR